MNKLFTYIPPILLLLVILLMDSLLIKLIMISLLICLTIYSKYRRSKLEREEVEYDDRVNINISKWSLRIIFTLNTLLILALFLINQNIIKIDLSTEFILFYLLITLFVPFYIVPAIIKHF